MAIRHLNLAFLQGIFKLRRVTLGEKLSMRLADVTREWWAMFAMCTCAAVWTTATKHRLSDLSALAYAARDDGCRRAPVAMGSA